MLSKHEDSCHLQILNILDLDTLRHNACKSINKSERWTPWDGLGRSERRNLMQWPRSFTRNRETSCRPWTLHGQPKPSTLGKSWLLSLCNDDGGGAAGRLWILWHKKRAISGWVHLRKKLNYPRVFRADKWRDVSLVVNRQDIIHSPHAKLSSGSLLAANNTHRMDSESMKHLDGINAESEVSLSLSRANNSVSLGLYAINPARTFRLLWKTLCRGIHCVNQKLLTDSQASSWEQLQSWEMVWQSQTAKSQSPFRYATLICAFFWESCFSQASQRF